MVTVSHVKNVTFSIGFRNCLPYLDFVIASLVPSRCFYQVGFNIGRWLFCYIRNIYRGFGLKNTSTLPSYLHLNNTVINGRLSRLSHLNVYSFDHFIWAPIMHLMYAYIWSLIFILSSDYTNYSLACQSRIQITEYEENVHKTSKDPLKRIFFEHAW